MLIDLESKDIEDPLAQFNHTFPTKDSVFGLVKTLNNTLGPSGLDIRILDQVFNTYWPQFENKFKEILSNTSNQTPAKPRPKEDVLGEILENTRVLASRIRKIEFETSRYNIKHPMEMSMDEIRNQAIKMAKAGVPFDVFIDRFDARVPSNMKQALSLIYEKEKLKD